VRGDLRKGCRWPPVYHGIVRLQAAAEMASAARQHRSRKNAAASLPENSEKKKN